MPKWRNRQTHAPQKRAGDPRAGSSPAFGTTNGAIAQLVERLNRTQEVSGSNPLSSTTFLDSSAVEHPAVNRRVVGSNPTRGAIFWPHGQAVKTLPFHGGIRGSNPLGVTNCWAVSSAGEHSPHTRGVGSSILPPPTSFEFLLLGFACRGVEQLAARRAHNPKVAGSSPAPATNYLL